MVKKKRSRLGKGLGALLGDVQQATTTPAATSTTTSSGPFQEVDIPPTVQPEPRLGLRELPVEQLQRGQYQPRLNMDQEALEELAESIRTQGIIQPLLVRQIDRHQFEIIAGERRWRGAQIAGLATVPAVVREIDNETAMAVALIENIQRQDLNAIEEALGFQRLLDEFGLTHEEVATAIGRSRSAVTNSLRLLGLESRVRSLVETGDLAMGHARALLGLPESRQLEAARKVTRGGLSVRATEHMVKRMTKVKKVDADPAGAGQDVRQLETELSERIGAQVEIKQAGKKGRLVIHYHSLDELDGILARIK